MRLRITTVLAIAMIPVIAAAQQFFQVPPGTPADPNTRYEVAAIKAGEASGQVPPNFRSTPGQFVADNVPLGLLLRQALQKSDYRIVGLPDWIDTTRYSIRATTPEGLRLTASTSLSSAANTTMLLNLLKDRFQLATHSETRELPIFDLVIARSDGRLGPSLGPTPAESQAIIAERSGAAKAAEGRGEPPPSLPFGDANGPEPCGVSRGSVGLIVGSGRMIGDLALLLADLVGRPVIDKTRLAGMYDYALRFAPESAGLQGILRFLPRITTPAIDTNVPSLSVALQEQLGLKLESARGPVEVVVIDRIERPTLD
jgi:uncharacterized protein (TIGR03435 family)